MDGNSHSKHGLPNTPRINDLILEYYQKFGSGRDLERFMRFYSPSGSSQDSQRTDCSNNRPIGACCTHTKYRDSVPLLSCDSLEKMPSHPLSSGCCGLNSKSMPNIDLQGTNCDGAKHIVDINIEIETDTAKHLSASTECIQTPKRCMKSNVKHTQTPESVAKSHRRLEWDSLGDIGYIKSMSTSNISVLERSLLREFFKESSANSVPSSSVHENSEKEKSSAKELHNESSKNTDQFSLANENSDKGDIHVKEQHKIIQIEKNACTEQATPPLASSTLVEIGSMKAQYRGARPKMVSQSTSSTSLQKKFEKFAQTSFIKPANMQSQEIQVNLSSSASLIDETATPSSFEYRSSLSSKSSENVGSDVTNRSCMHDMVHPFITRITELLAKRKHSANNNVPKQIPMDHIHVLQSKFQAALDENKENKSQNTLSSTSTSFSLTRQAPELDLGIQLICSLIDAKSLNGKQKKKLIRDIVKRISRLNENDHIETSTENTSESNKSGESHSTISEKQNVYDSVHTSGRNVLDKSCQALLNLPCELGVTPIHKEVMTIRDKILNCKNENTNTLNDISKAPETHNVNTQTTTNRSCNKHGSNKKCIINNKQISSQIETMMTVEENRNEALNFVSNMSSPRKRNREALNQINKLQKITSRDLLCEQSNLLLRTRSTQTSKSSISIESQNLRKTPSSSTTSSEARTTSSSSSHDLPTQKSLRKPSIYNLNADGDQATMGEWLNPLTQSEIEYEEKRREESERKQREKDLVNQKQKQTRLKQDGERREQLSWIEKEIQRLEGLKHLILKDNTSERSIISHRLSDESSLSHKSKKDSSQQNKLYDTVCSDKSSILSESAELLVKEIEYILEESNEEIVNVKDKSKKSKGRKKETQIIYEKPPNENVKKEKYMSVKETITTNEEKVKSHPATFPPTQRKKIDTPTTSDQSPEITESLRDLVKQKKRDFIEAYKMKKQNHYDALRQQQRVQAKSYYMSLKAFQPTALKHIGHYAVPHNINHQFSPTEYAFPQNRLPTTPEDDGPHTETSSDVKYSSAANKNGNEVREDKSISTTTASYASMFCVSSDVSVPMGSNNVSSTPTTTHHYDDVAAAVAGVAVQTSDSVLRSQPIFGPQLRPYFQLHGKSATQRFSKPIITNTAAIQVKPRGIAYIIEFENDTDAYENSSEKVCNINPTDPGTSVSICTMIKPSNGPQMTLQDHLEKAKPKFLQQSKERKAILNRLQSMRQERDRQLREIIDNTSFNSLERRLQYLPPPPTQKIRILNTKEMKALTNKRFASLPEVLAQKERELEERKRRSNRVLRDIFNRRLQKRVRSGKLSLNHSKTVI